MVRRVPEFLVGLPWRTRISKATRFINHRVYYVEGEDQFEYERDPNPARGTWHQVRWRTGEYRDIDPDTGQPIAGKDGEWRKLR